MKTAQRDLKHLSSSKMIEAVCPTCGSNHWVLMSAIVDDYVSTPIEFADKCPYCQAKQREKDITGVPPQYYEAGLEKFNFSVYSHDMQKLKHAMEKVVQNYPEWQKRGTGLYFTSKTPGSGKTFLACALGKTLMMKYDLQLRFITAPGYLAKVGESYKRAPGAQDETEVYRNCDLLILDDIGSEKQGEWQTQELFRLIDERANYNRITIYTSNVPTDKLRLDARTVDRIIASVIPIAMPEESIRRKVAQRKQENLKKILLPGNAIQNAV